jgi:hypothetical protein
MLCQPGRTDHSPAGRGDRSGAKRPVIASGRPAISASAIEAAGTLLPGPAMPKDQTI